MYAGSGDVTVTDCYGQYLSRSESKILSNSSSGSPLRY